MASAAWAVTLTPLSSIRVCTCCSVTLKGVPSSTWRMAFTGAAFREACSSLPFRPSSKVTTFSL